VRSRLLARLAGHARNPAEAGRTLLLAALALAALAAGHPAAAWSHSGHRVAAAVAWERLSPEVRERVVELLLAAPPESGIPDLMPTAGPLAERRRELFLAAATWPDLVKHSGSPFDHGGWHYTNRFWRSGPRGEAVPVPGLRAAAQNVVERIRTVSRTVADRGEPPAQRALDLAWLLHLVADIHQPLHTSARVTGRRDERRGDRGGNTFLLHRDRRGERWNLHAYWDRILDNASPRRRGESEAAWIDRLAAEALAAAPPGSFPLHAADPDAWAAEGVHLAQTEVYRGVERLHEPPAAYRQRALALSLEALSRSGQRLAELLEHTLATPDPGR